MIPFTTFPPLRARARSGSRPRSSTTTSRWPHSTTSTSGHTWRTRCRSEGKEGWKEGMDAFLSNTLDDRGYTTLSFSLHLGLKIESKSEEWPNRRQIYYIWRKHYEVKIHLFGHSDQSIYFWYAIFSKYCVKCSKIGPLSQVGVRVNRSFPGS